MDEALKSLLDFGGIGILAIILLVFARSLLQREQARADAQALEVQRLNNLMVEKTIPALISATNAIAASQSLLQSMQYRADIEAQAKKAAGVNQ